MENKRITNRRQEDRRQETVTSIIKEENEHLQRAAQIQSELLPRIMFPNFIIASVQKGIYNLLDCSKNEH